MKVTLLGTGTSNGVPMLGCQCAVCRSEDKKDKRLRCVALVETDTTRLLIDCGPDIRRQLMPLPYKRIDGVLLTHIHYDHVAGIDDLRPYCKFGDIDLYANESTAAGLRHNMPYCFTDTLYPGVPRLNLHTIQPHAAFQVGDLQVLPLEVLHGQMPIMAYRLGKFAYITDMKSISEDNKAYLTGIQVLVVNALRFDKTHHSHQLVKDAIAFSQSLGVKTTILTHVNHDIGLHDEVQQNLPEGVYLGYDGISFDME